MVARPSHQGRGTWDGWWGRLRLRSAGRPHAPNGCERTNQALAFGNAFVRSLVTGFLGTHPSAEMPAASGIGEDSGWGWLVGDNAPPSESASAKERTISVPVPSRPPIVIVKPDEAVVSLFARAQRFAPAVAGHQAQANPPSRTHRNDAIHYVGYGLASPAPASDPQWDADIQDAPLNRGFPENLAGLGHRYRRGERRRDRSNKGGR